MAYKFLLSIDPQQEYRVGLLSNYLFEHKLIVSKGDVGSNEQNQELFTTVIVENNERFLAYLNRKSETRQLDNDPGDIIKNWVPLGVTGKASRTSKEGRLAAARKRNARKDLKFLKEQKTQKAKEKSKN